MRLLLKNAKVATNEMVYTSDLLIEGGRIAKIGESLDEQVDRVVDVRGRYLIPGGVDVHTHFNLDVGIAVATDDFYTGTVAAACGGTTTIVDHMGFGPKGCDLHHQLNKYMEDARENAVIDYGFHGVIQHLNEDILDEFSSMVEDGVTSFKGYMTYDYKLDDSKMAKIMERLGNLGAMTTVHAEVHEDIERLKYEHTSKGLGQAIYHAKSRPVSTEVEAIKRMIDISKKASDAPLYVVHLSSGDGLDVIREARKQGGNIYAETCPQYLFLNEERYLEEDGLKYVMSPPLRGKDSSERLWEGIKDGSIQTIATDHCPFDYTLKKSLGEKDFTKCPNGAPGVELRVALLYSEGVEKGRIGIKRFVDLVSTTPAKLFGLYPRKGSISVGADADLVIIDPSIERTIKQEDLHENVDYTPYEGMMLKGYPVMTISKGEIIVEEGKFIGKKGRGEYLRRDPSFR